MWIKNTNSATRRLFNTDITDDDGEPLLDEPVEFASNGTAQVTQEVGAALVDHYDDIEHKETDT